MGKSLLWPDTVWVPNKKLKFGAEPFDVLELSDDEFTISYQGKRLVFPLYLIGKTFYKSGYEATVVDVGKGKQDYNPPYSEIKLYFPTMGLASWLNQNGYIRDEYWLERKYGY